MKIKLTGGMAEVTVGAASSPAGEDIADSAGPVGHFPRNNFGIFTVYGRPGTDYLLTGSGT
ncbi:hypothetical protein FO440_21970 [Mucilaginibacter corticis]|uniref:Uncharacterized protein n=1 Tax=Mucilaginibacter corticis TaxID=2597670 RepID=A0A556M9C8_9SPHI|nr:hypothetical protein [Mucilaginibacter corticis]TSJ36502.1 hypothetical protein FO440_21970 [Mucilaginibacter corticis]